MEATIVPAVHFILFIFIYSVYGTVAIIIIISIK